MVLVGTREVATPELDKISEAREPKPLTLTRFLDWLRDQQIKFVHVDDSGRESAVASVILRTLAQEVVKDGETAGSQDLGEVLEVWNQHGLSACYHYGERCPWPKEIEEVERNSWRVSEQVVTLPEGYYLCSWSIERLLAEFYGIDRDAADREKDALLGALRAA